MAIISRLRHLIKNFYLLLSLTERELKSRYKGSILGFFWSFLHPLLYVTVLTLIFQFIVKVKIDRYPLFILTGLLPWLFFSTSLSQSTNSILVNAPIIKKIYLPKEIFPLSIVLANLINFVFSILILIFILVLWGIKLNWLILICTLPWLILLTTFFCTGVSLLCACLNVFFRDLTHLMGIILTLWFYATPIFYTVEMVPAAFFPYYLLNPLATLIPIYRDIILFQHLPSINYLFLNLFFTSLVFIVGYGIFIKYDNLFAELI